MAMPLRTGLCACALHYPTRATQREPPEVKRRIFFSFLLLPSDRRQPVLISVGALCGGLLPPLPSHNTRRLAVFGGGATLPLATRKPTRAKARGSGGGVVP